RRLSATPLPYTTLFRSTTTASTELEAVQWGCRELERLHALHARLHSEGRLPATQLTRETARDLGLEELISGLGPEVAAPALPSRSEEHTSELQSRENLV